MSISTKYLKTSEVVAVNKTESLLSFKFIYILLNRGTFLVFAFHFSSAENFQVPAICSVLILELGK